MGSGPNITVFIRSILRFSWCRLRS